MFIIKTSSIETLNLTIFLWELEDIAIRYVYIYIHYSPLYTHTHTHKTHTITKKTVLITGVYGCIPHLWPPLKQINRKRLHSATPKYTQKSHTLLDRLTTNPSDDFSPIHCPAEQGTDIHIHTYTYLWQIVGGLYRRIFKWFERFTECCALWCAFSAKCLHVTIISLGILY